MTVAVARWVTVAVLLNSGLSSATGGSEFLAPGDAVELANLLGEATEEQDVCYGWNVVINGQEYGSSPAALAALASAATETPTGSPSPSPTPSPPPVFDESGGHIGSNAGPGVRVEEVPGCERWAEFTARLTYTPEYSESEDSASYELSSDFADFTDEDLKKLGIEERALLGDEDDVAVYTATAALPLIVADKGLAPHLTAEPNAAPLPPADEATDSPGSDVLRSDPFIVAFLVILVCAGICWLAYLVFAERPGRLDRRAKRSRWRETGWHRADPHRTDPDTTEWEP
jgi:hypothetical protein